ncbi:MAG: redoxin domain-containing protein [Pirellulaceae bacterium]|jgi:hypothetical protein|nr:redoxin domain-containing protein [Pirellulaceae bacterium]MDP7017693.1 redoxin domain-containing protein [Pirellulaceae bacterium]
MHILLRLFFVVLFLVAFLVPVAGAAEPVDVDWTELRSVDGAPLTIGGAKWKVVCFLGSECPLARLYGARLQKLAAEFRSDGVQLVGVNSNRQDSPADIERYLEKHRLTFPIIKDVGQDLARRFGATRTPEVFVLDADDRIRYQGRIDDQYEPGISRAAPTRRILRKALRELIAGSDVSAPKTVAVGCLITFTRAPQKVAPEETVTFVDDVAPILNRHCVECHRAGEIGPFQLTDYNEVVGWGEMMLEVIQQQRMPPWHADPEHGEFVGERKFPESALKMLTAWVEQGMPSGDLNALPPPPEWSAGWHLPESPDLVIAMRDRPFVVPSDGTVEYQYFVVNPQWEKDRWVRAAQVAPGDASVVHHAIVFVRPPDGEYTAGIGWMGGYVPGQRAAMLPAGHARRIPARSKLVFQMHYTPNGQSTPDKTKVGVWFSDPDEVTHVVTTQVALNHNFEIPPGAKSHSVGFQLDRFARESRLLSVMPHMHLRGKSFQIAARRASGDATLLSVPNYDFNWQHWYQLKKPLPLSDVRSLEMEVRFDNSADNPTNPDPKEFVRWGDQTWEEMAVAFIDVGHPRDKQRVIERPDDAETRASEAVRSRRVAAEVERFLSQMDRNRDGVVEREEAPDAFRRFGFRRMDRNRDDRLTRSEIESAAARRF